MKVSLTRVNNAVHFVAKGEDGQEIHIDGSPSIGGLGLGMRPMELVLSALASCSGIDIVTMLSKNGGLVKDFSVEMEGLRAERKVPQVFTSIHLIFKIRGDFTNEAVSQAISLSLDRFCSVAAMLRPGVSISHEYILEA